MQNGLTKLEAIERLNKYGKNVLVTEKEKTKLEIFLSQFVNYTTPIFGVAIIICLFLKDYGEAGFIGFVLLMNAIVGYVQEGKAQSALDALKKMTNIKAVVKRDGKIIEIDAEELVPGDYVLLEAGKEVPADIRLLSTSNMQTTESSLTGESVPVDKDSNEKSTENTPIGDRKDMAFMSTFVSYGRGEGIVEKTGMNTEMGKIAKMLQNTKKTLTPLQENMGALTKFLGILVVILCIALYIIALIQNRDTLEMLKTAVSLAVAAIPEGLPSIVTIVLAIGVQKMAKKNAIVRDLPSVETLGAVGIVCSDKTGTLTQNKMTVVKAYKDDEYKELTKLNIEKDKLFLYGFMLCTDAVVSEDKEIGDPTETALVRFALNYDLDKNIIEKTAERINEKPFDSNRKLMTTVNLIDGKAISFTKGSTDELLKKCTKIMINGRISDITQKDKETILSKMEEMSKEALRVLGLAIKEENKDALEEDLVFVGMVGMIDPERPEVKDSIATLKRAGIKTVMITGDHKVTAFAIAKRLGIAESIEECIMGDEVDKMSDEELANRANNLSVFARVSPEHKVRIVKAYQTNGHLVSMTGDGTNDSPALKEANCGIAMGIQGTDVAKNAANIILCDDKFTTITEAVKGGRGIFENYKKSGIFALSSNFGEVITMCIAIISGLMAPLNAVHILWVNLITDSLPCFGLGIDNYDEDLIMSKPPRNPKENLFHNGGLFTILFYGFIISVITLLGFLYVPVKQLLTTEAAFSISAMNDILSNPDVLLKSQTIAFCILAVSQLFHAVGMRNTEKSIFKMNHLENKVMVLAFVLGLILQILVTEIPFLTELMGTTALSFLEWMGILFVSIIPLIFHELFVLIKKVQKK